MSTLALFDIDNTLLSGTRQHYAAFVYSWKHVYGIKTLKFDWHDIRQWKAHEGKTDSQVILEVAKKHGAKDAEAKLFDAAKATSEYYIKNSYKEDLKVLPGVTELLDSLRKKGVSLGVVTGNLEPIARRKLALVKLDRFFRVGAFSGEALHRSELVRIAIEQAELNYKKDFARNSIYFFGDTVRDADAAQCNKINGISVATGMFGMERLKKCGQFAVVQDLSDWRKILRIMDF